MFYRQTLFFLLFLLCSVKAFSTVFVVTSNADSGTGTLRDALTQAAANGNAVKDSIIFNLPDTSAAGRTINILTLLPTITSDMLLDGSTQPGSPLSVNGAKIMLSISYAQDPQGYNFIAGLYIKGVNNLEIDGFVIKGLYNNLVTSGSYGGAGILIDGVNTNIVIGQPGKGNVIYDNSQAIVTTVGGTYYFPVRSQTNNITLKNNFIGVKEDGVTIATSIQSEVIIDYTANITIGGDTKSEGNVFYGIIGLSPAGYTDNMTANASIKIRNNIFGANYLQQKSTDPNVITNQNSLYVSLGVDPNLVYTYSSGIQISDNTFGCSLAVQGFQNLNLLIQHNFFGVSNDLQNKLPVPLYGLLMAYMQGTILVGGDDVSKGNVFTNCSQDTLLVDQYPVVNVQDFGQTLSPQFKVALSHNSFYCNGNVPFAYSLTPVNKPLIPLSVDNLTPNTVSGTSVPNASVELFYTDKECTQCQPKVYIATASADANGKWTYSGNLLSGYGVMAGATLNQVSSEFTDTRIYFFPPYAQVTGSECGSNGSITGLFTANAKTIEWLDSANNVVGTNIDLTNAPPGKYTLKAAQFGCVVYSSVYTVLDVSPRINPQYMQVVNPSCGKLGSITGIFAIYDPTVAWLDASGNVVGNQLDIENLPAGSYTLQVTGQRGCVKTYGPIVLINTTGPNIDQSKVAITSTNCGQSAGSITNLNITGTGIIKYTWLNSQQQTVGTDSILTNQPAGTYKLEVADATQCGPVFSTDLLIPEINGITLNETGAKISVASCAQNNGSVTGITATGATQYQWTDATGNVVGSAIDLLKVASGYYVLTVSNGFGCSKTSTSYHVGQQAATQFPVYAVTIYQACTGKSNGGINVPVDTLVTLERWTNATGQTINTGIGISGVPAGVYMLYLTDKNGCEQLFGTYEIPDIPQLTINANSGQITNDQCGNKIASVKNIEVTGGRPPCTYAWLDAGNNVVSTSPNLTGVSAGTYTFTVNDATTCGIVSAVYTIQNQDNIIPAPSVSNLQVCSAGDALISVNNIIAGYSYRLYADNSTSTPLDTESDGKFKISIKANATYYVSQVSGTCESDRTQVQVSVGLSSIDIVNTFTPNGDGVNDYWKITSIENYPNALVQVFSRYGQKVFESKGYTQQFDGTQNGKRLPSGVYYYIINLQDNCNLLSGSLTLIR